MSGSPLPFLLGSSVANLANTNCAAGTLSSIATSFVKTARGDIDDSRNMKIAPALTLLLNSSVNEPREQSGSEGCVRDLQGEGSKTSVPSAQTLSGLVICRHRHPPSFVVRVHEGVPRSPCALVSSRPHPQAAAQDRRDTVARCRALLPWPDCDGAPQVTCAWLRAVH